MTLVEFYRGHPDVEGRAQWYCLFTGFDLSSWRDDLDSGDNCCFYLKTLTVGWHHVGLTKLGPNL